MERNHSHSWPVTRTKGVELAAKVAADLELSSKQGMTLAGHDSINITGLVPTVMLFVPNVDGISHNEHEYTTAADIVAGLAMGVVREKVDGLHNRVHPVERGTEIFRCEIRARIGDWRADGPALC